MLVTLVFIEQVNEGTAQAVTVSGRKSEEIVSDL